MIVAFEGIDGVGKTTQITLLSQIYKDAIITKEPGGTKFGEKLREILLNEKISKKAEIMLFLADRAQHFEQIIKPNLQKLILSDRSFISGIAYALANDENLSLEKLFWLNKFVLDEILPDKFIFLKANFKNWHNRLENRRLDAIEKRGIAYLKKVEECMEMIFEKYNFDILYIDSSLEISVIHNKILEFIQ